MPRPKKLDDGSWHSSSFEIDVPENERTKFDSFEWSFRKDGRSCVLGFNPVTALIMPRPIGWISTYRKEGRILHLAPYSFFTDVARGSTPMVAFSGYRKEGKVPKDAQQDAQDMGCFGYNMVTEDLAVAMNYSAAELERPESEFELAGLVKEDAALIDAPLVRDAKMKLECEYVKTVDVETFSIVIGKVVKLHLSGDVLTDGAIDFTKLRPITRLGYMDEYGVLPQII
jgi:flavin reductase (DIM6/NTAB) family NADH-FMN oxidoreductase RutF